MKVGWSRHSRNISAFTEDRQHDRAVTTFLETYDKNHDGRVTKSELDAIGQLPANFKDLDSYPSNADGSHGDGIIDMHDYGPVPTEEMVGVEAYMQKIGTAGPEIVIEVVTS